MHSRAGSSCRIDPAAFNHHDVEANDVKANDVEAHLVAASQLRRNCGRLLWRLALGLVIPPTRRVQSRPT
jgi:hypothetical protein